MLVMLKPLKPCPAMLGLLLSRYVAYMGSYTSICQTVIQSQPILACIPSRTQDFGVQK
jgi:hypothetical protein